MVSDGYFDTTWELTVYPVLSTLRHSANQLLRTEGLPAIVDWLQHSSRPSWLAVSQKLEIDFDPEAASLAPRRSAGA